MKNTIKIGTATALAVACTALFSGAAETNHTYTVTVPDLNGNVLWSHTNCVEVRRHERDCVLVRYVVKYPGKPAATNDFHAWMVPVHVATNKPSRR